MRAFFLLILGLVIGAASGIFVDRHPATAPTIDEYWPFTDTVEIEPEPAPLVLSESLTDFSESDLAQFAIKSCFSGARPEVLTDQQTGEALERPWLTRVELGPLTSAKRAAFPYPDLETLPGLVKVEQILSPTGSMKHHCSASRVAENWFLTAAHCVRLRGDTRPIYDIAIAAPREDVDQPDTPLVPVSGAVCHSAYFSSTGRFDDDLALLYVEDPAPLGDVAIVPYDTREAPLPKEAFTSARFGGWGKNGQNRFLQGSDLNVTTIGETLILADNETEFGPCTGDSGGPMLVDGENGPVIAGVLSAVTTDRCPLWGQAYYARVKTFSDWITNAIAICGQGQGFACSEPIEEEISENVEFMFSAASATSLPIPGLIPLDETVPAITAEEDEVSGAE